jgi:hypothetical protein
VITRARLLTLLPACLLLYGAEGCPLFPDPQGQTGADGGLEVMDLGGEDGAYWQVTHGADVLVTLRAGGTSASARSSPGGASLALLYSSVHLASFCPRSDTLCPGTVLPLVTAMIQPRGSGNRVYVGFNRQGPLAFLGSQAGLIGVVSGSALSVPLATTGLPQTSGDLCALQSGSRISATAGGAADRAETLTGAVTLVYAWKCFNIGGSSQVQRDALVELSTTFSARRR